MLKRALVQASPVWQYPELRRQYDLASFSLREDISSPLEAAPLRAYERFNTTIVLDDVQSHARERQEICAPW
jgi:hypothetical protein